MRTFGILLFVFGLGWLCSAICGADSIKIQDRRYDDVFIIDSKGFYRVFSPDGKEIENVVKQRKDISDVSIDRASPKRLQFLQGMRENDNAGKRSLSGEKETVKVPVPTSERKLVLRGDPAVAEASIAAHDAAMAALGAGNK